MDEIDREKFMYDLVRNTQLVNEVGLEVLQKIKKSVFFENYKEEVQEDIRTAMNSQFDILKAENDRVIKKIEDQLNMCIRTIIKLKGRIND